MAPPNANDAKNAAQKTPTRSTATRPSPSKTPSVNGVGSGLGRTPSLRGGLARPARGGLNRNSPQSSFLSTSSADDHGDDEARAEHASLLDDLRNRVQKAETASEEYQRQLNLLQARLDESLQSQGQLEDQLNQKKERVEELETEKTQASRQKRDLEKIFDEERTAMLKDRDEQKAKQQGLQTSLQRMKDSLAQKEQELAEEREAASSQNLPEANSEGGQFAPPSSLQRNVSSDSSKLIEQKDRAIKSLRLELADAQIKIMEIDSDGKYHDLEKKLLETQITNARLMEDNESFQLLLNEKTLNGDFSKTELMQTSSGLGSLAEELGTEDIESAEGAEGKSDDCRRLEVEVKSLKDQNKALALYIENIIGRLLSHSEFENILDKNPDLMSGAPKAPARANTDKDLPPPPPEKDNANEGAGSFLQRAKSVIAGPGKPRPRPMSHMPPPSADIAPPNHSPLLNEDPSTAPSIPIGRSQSVSMRGGAHAHKRSQSDMPGAGPIVNQMYRGPPSSGSPALGGPLMSPGISPGINNAGRTSFFSPPAPPAPPSTLISSNPPPRAPSGSRNSMSHDLNPGSDSGSVMSDRSGGGPDSPPRNGTSNNYTGAIMTQNRLRPLRLVQENPESKKKEEDAAAAARKKANRGSWMPTWMAQRGPSGGEGQG